MEGGDEMEETRGRGCEGGDEKEEREMRWRR